MRRWVPSGSFGSRTSRLAMSVTHSSPTSPTPLTCGSRGRRRVQTRPCCSHRFTVDRYYDPSTDQFLSVDPAVAQTGQPYAYTGDDPLNATDPLGLTAGPQPPPRALCSSRALRHVHNCMRIVKKQQACGRLGCYDKQRIRHARPEALGLALLLTTGGAGDVIEGVIGRAVARVAATEAPEAATAIAARAGPALLNIGVSGVVAKSLEYGFDQIAQNPGYPGPVRSMASLDSKIVQVADVASDVRDLVGVRFLENDSRS